jgi:ZIP family zinc transporter
MSGPETALLGAIAGLTIFLGLPMGRMHDPKPALKAALNAIAIGILVFILFDVLAKANGTLETALIHKSGLHFVGQSLVALAALGLGLVGLVYYDRWLGRRAGTEVSFGPGAAAVEELQRRSWLTTLSPPRRLALCIAIGIGLHNFAEGLSIGQSAAQGEISLALALIIGFGLHNATEGFGIVAPLASGHDRPSWGFLLLMGLIGGGPTFAGTIVGQSFVNDTVFLGFLALAAGSILYVVIQLVQVAQKLGFKELLMWGVAAGLVLGFATDYVLVAAGA